MGIFNFFIVIPEIVASLGFGWVMAHVLGNNRLAAVVAGAVFLAIAAGLIHRVRDASEAGGPELSRAVAG
jgi:maltose/moltooligosaccharide transporter